MIKQRFPSSFAPVSSELVALDHDMMKASIMPSVVLECEIPVSVDKSFVWGRVITVINDSVFQTSSPFRHAAILKKVIEKYKEPPKIVYSLSNSSPYILVWGGNFCIYIFWLFSLIVICVCGVCIFFHYSPFNTISFVLKLMYTNILLFNFNKPLCYVLLTSKI